MKIIIFRLLLFPFCSRGLKILLPVFICLLYLPLFVSSEPANNISLSLAVEILFPDRGRNSVLKEIIQSSIAIEIQRAGISVNYVDAEVPEEVFRPEEAFAEEIMKKHEFPVVLVCFVTGEETNLRLEFLLHVKDMPELTVRTVKEEKIDLNIDEAISEAVSEILLQINGYIPVLASEPTIEEPAAAETVPKQISEQPELPDETFRPFRGSLGVAPFLAVGKVNYYFNMGMISSIQGGYTFETDLGSIEAGLTLGVLYFEALGLQSSSSNFILPLGATGRWSTGFFDHLLAFLTVAGGPALFILQTSDAEQFLKLLGFVSVGVGSGLRFSSLLSITVEVDYLLFFEEYYPIMGVVPSIYFDIRF